MAALNDTRRREKTEGVEVARKSPVRKDAPVFLSARDRINRRYSLSAGRMPNGDPPTLTLWGEE